MSEVEKEPGGVALGDVTPTWLSRCRAAGPLLRSRSRSSSLLISSVSDAGGRRDRVGAAARRGPGQAERGEGEEEASRHGREPRGSAARARSHGPARVSLQGGVARRAVGEARATDVVDAGGQVA